ncbi:glycosyltransferase [Halomonas sp. KAO]|uniref:glycosyltransferase n=1 Tax=Halomonas sp. KAO TaxID=2783858 RepID=UPI00189E4EF2|nr:glycosyltransferase [Halomonas sp. KAO]MBF7051770.1 glycosyltransferase [Halomonas sp. KAO]
MDDLLHLATQLAAQPSTPLFASVRGRVAYVVSHGQSYASNGYAVRTQGIAQALNQQGLETLCFVRPGRPWELGVESRAIAPEVKVEGVRYLHSRWPGDQAPANEQEHLKSSVARLVELFRVYRPAAVLVASNHIVGLPAWVAAKRLGLPFYNEVRGFWELTREAREPGYANTLAYKAEYERDVFVARQALKIFTLNQSMKDELARRDVDPSRVEIVPNGVTELPKSKVADPALKQKLGIQEGDKVVGYIGSFSAYEGLDTLVAACQQRVEQGEKLKLLLVGDDQPVTQTAGASKALADKPWLIQVGRVPHDQVADYYALLDAVVIPRRKLPVCERVPPLKAAEALAYGKRLVVSNIAPLKEYADKHDGVVTFEAENATSLATALQGSLKVPAPKPNSELLFAMHTEPMVRALKGEGSAAVQNTAVMPAAEVEPAAALVEIAPKRLTLNGNSKKTVAYIIKVPVPGATLELSAAVVYRLKSAATTRKAVLLFDFLDKDGNKKASIPGIGVAAAFKQHFRYLNANSKSVDDTAKEVFKLTLPEDVASVSLSVGTLGIKDDEQVELCIQGRCYSEAAEKERKRQLLQRQPLPDAIVHDPGQKRLTSDLTVACVLDEFTAECLSHEVTLIKVTQEAWQAQLEQNPPDFLLVESCWKGNDGNWGTITKGSGGGKKLSGLLRYCKQQGIPTVFWNKEDPPHYDKFGPIAKLFDLAITTDVNMVPRYKEDFGIEAHPLSFGAQPKVHNPEPVIPRLQKAVFAGSYYGDKPKRCDDFNDVMGQLEMAGVAYDIFDRNYQQGIEKFAFPDHYQGNIVGNLPPDEVWKAHKGYKYQVNMNSVQDSATMFARRVYESLASGTPVISNDSVGVRQLFGDVVIMPGEQSIAEQLRALEASSQAYQALARRGVRAVMREHTYGHRIQALCQLLGMEVEVALPKATLAVTASSEADIQRAKQLFDAQTAQNKQLFIELENFDTAYQFLNQSNDTVTYAMRLAHEFYTDERDYYGHDRVLKHDVSQPLPAEALEDFLYWSAWEPNAAQTPATHRMEVSA